jgi:amino acid adenylation domain-containing protein
MDVKLSLDGDRLRYSAPQGTMSPALLKELADNKEEVCKFLNRAQEGMLSASASVRPVPRDGDLPLSFAQERMWLINQLAPASSAYNIATAIRLQGTINVSALEQALDEIVRRHEVLRTTFTVVDGRPAPVVQPPSGHALLIFDLRSLTEAGRKECCDKLAAQHAERLFDLSKGPLLLTTLLRPGDTDHMLLLTMHHIVSDGWSLAVFTRETLSLYAAFASGRPSSLPELPIQYADFAAWQRHWLEGGTLEKQLVYWKQQLGDQPPALELPTDRTRPAVQTDSGASESFSLSRALTSQLQAIGRRAGATFFMVLLAAFETLLYRYTGQTDISVGTPIANRNRAEIEGLIGFFVNTLVLRAKLNGDESFSELLRRVREITLGAYVHQDVPFEKLVEELQPERDTSRSPLLQVMLALQNLPREEVHLQGLLVSPLDLDNHTAKFDLTLDIDDSGPELRCLFAYNTDLFDAATIRRLSAHFVTLLESIVHSPEQRLAELPLLTKEEHHQLLFEWNDTAVPFPSDKAIDQLFQEQTARTPDAVALVFGAEQLTYAELNARANRLAHHLRGLGVGPEVLVGICVERSFEMVVALLGVLKAGGAFVPLDPALPAERLAFMLADTSAPVVLSQRSLVSRLPEMSSSLVLIDEEHAAVSSKSTENLRVVVSPHNLAYVTYTSGSTGRPKGVAITRRSVVAFIHWACTVFSPEQLAGTLASTSICFDLSIFELFVPLACGGTIILAENVLQLPDLPAARQVTLVNTVPTAMGELLHLDIPASVRTVNLAGEPLQNALVQQIYQQMNAAEVWNLYGPSEDTVYSTCTLVARGALHQPTIGRPIANTQVRLLDRNLQAVAIGVVGNLYLSGDGLARGYLARPALTAERFLPDPFGTVPGARMYTTGDTARYRADGAIEYLGRIDQQVKLRGFRIELGEIEAALNQFKSVREVVVVVRGVTEGEKQLVAYVVTEPGRQPTVSELLEQVRSKLPGYMVPSAFVFLKKMPLLPNGKINRRALPAPDGKRPNLQQAFAAPLTELERTIATVWQDVLRVESVSVHDNFFDLGGHSLLMIQVQEKLRKAFDRELPLVDLFQYSTVNSLAKHLSGNQGESTPHVSHAEKLGLGKDRLRQLRLSRQGLKVSGNHR